MGKGKQVLLLGLLLLLLALVLPVMAFVTARQYPQPHVIEPPVSQQPPKLAPVGNATFVHEKLGAYHSVGPSNKPAWDISHDPELVKQFGGGRDGVVLVRCNCGLVIRMLGQVIHADGSVQPSIWHDVPECGYHVMGTFEGWDKGEWDTAGKEDSPQSH